MPFDLTNAPATFNRLMTDLFREGLDNFVLVFFDDTLVYSKTKEEHEQHLRQVLEILRTAKLYAKRSKCLFFVEKIAYLGFIVSKDGLSPDRAKISLADFILTDGLLYYKERMCIPFRMRSKILIEAHDNPLAAHPGYHKMFPNLKKDFFWPRMKKDTLDYVRRCLIYQKTKVERVKIPGKLEPLDIPQMKWECISMDFFTGLPKTTGNYDSIFVIVDKLTKVAHLIPVKQTATAADIAQVFVKKKVRLHGIPARIISDRDAKFTSKFWQAMFQSLGTQLNLNTAYHPETDGQTERVNQVIEDMLRAYCNQQPQKWIKFLHLVKFAYNSSHHRSPACHLLKPCTIRNV
ncbi:hypothetical protein L7F22_004720 [Adiantum nelumboides]|nr:hypothetical protein [Adiantum nelumboides]